ncbi:1,4-dihydroxy-2-naphthoate octaprenyltransferase [Dictyobacter arantiisoli]|uniref:1,4-dihydroxy-2-naphthoate octaprenyltransferase n=1 Tax=Dictyobacter arantiisoli TaxID=2014874 RepID=A0A5A5T868_9CHLR|nr:1,4-dihydroxy-2-naphthoate octaprenyltransferase [Dictyobacter arantiisoli]GCF07233.1 hypothetical protein KDI_07970 [Dictyobacter arantiisoli]
MENTEKKNATQEIIHDKELREEFSGTSSQATQVIDATPDSGATSNATPALDAIPDTGDVPALAQIEDASSTHEKELYMHQVVDANPDSNSEPQIVDANPDTTSESQTIDARLDTTSESKIVDTSLDTTSESKIVDASLDTTSESKIVDANPQNKSASQDADSTVKFTIQPAVSEMDKEDGIEQKQDQDHSLSHKKGKDKKRDKKKQQSSQVVRAETVPAEEVPTVPIGSLQSISTLKPAVSVHSVASMRAVGVHTPLVAQPVEYRRGLSEWIEIWRDGMRPGYLPLSLMPIILGSVLAWTQSLTAQHPFGHFNIINFALALISAIILQSGAHLINDYYDYQRGVDASNTMGPGGLIQQGLVKAPRMLYIGLGLLGLGGVVGLLASLAGGPLVCLFGLIIVLCAYFFSASPKALSTLGLSELVGFITFGLLSVMGAYMIQTHGQLSVAAFHYSLPLGFLAAATIYANNMRDIEGDAHVNKRTLATLLGLRWSRIAYIILMLAAYLVVVLLGVPHTRPHYVLIALWTLPGLVVAISGVLRTEISTGFDNVMRQTLKIYVQFTILLAIGLIIAYAIPVIPKIPANLLKLP